MRTLHHKRDTTKTLRRISIISAPLAILNNGEPTREMLKDQRD